MVDDPRRPLGVTFVVPHAGLLGGLRVISQFARKLHERGHRVCVVSVPRPEPGLARRAWRRLRGKRAPAPLSPKGSFFSDVPVEHRVLERHRPVRAGDLPDADAVVATWWQTAPGVAALPENKGAKLYLVQDYGAHDGQPLEAVRETWRLPLYKMVISRWIRSLVEEVTGDEEIFDLPTHVDLDQFHAAARGKRVRPTVGFMYSARPQKGIAHIVRAIEIARRSLPDLDVVAFGAPPPETGPALPDGTLYFANAPDEKLAEIYASCDAWLFASRLEGFGLPMLEAMACRTPIIAFPAGAAPELVEAGGGRLVPQGDSAAMAGAICELAGGSEQQWRLSSERAFETASQFSLEASVARLERALSRAVELETRARS